MDETAHPESGRDANTASEAAAEYRRQLARWAQDLALAERASVAANLADGSSDLHVKLFTDGNLDKRFNKLQNALEFVAGAFQDFDDLLAAYVRALPLAAYDTGSSDAERFLEWLADRHPLTPEQRDYVACQRGRFAVENAARANRPGHVRFQELAGAAAESAVALDAHPGLQLYFNPIHAWSRFHTSALLDEEATPPANVLFYAAGTEIATAVLEPAGQLLVRSLALYTPCTLDDWAAMNQHADRDELLEFCRDLAEMGLVAFG